MLAWPAKRKLVKPAKACSPPPRAEQPSGRGNDTHSLAIQVAAQIGGTARVLPELLAAEGDAVYLRNPRRFSGRAVVAGALEVASSGWLRCLPILIRPQLVPLLLA